MKKIEKQAFAFKVTYFSKLDVDQSDTYTEYFKKLGIPSGSKTGVVLNMCHSLPYWNDNAMGFTATTLRNSYESAMGSPINLDHNRDIILGTIVKPELYDEGEGKPLTLRAISVAWKYRVQEWWIDLQYQGWSMECAYNDYSFYVDGKIIEKTDAPVSWIENIDNWRNGIPVYDEKGNRVVLLLGGTDGIVDFNGLAITYSPADRLAETLLSVASKVKNEGGQDMFTQEQLDQAVANAVKETEDKMNLKVVALESEKNALANKVTETETKLHEVETKVTESEAKASALEIKIKEKEMDDRFKTRMDAIASKSLVIRDEKKEFIRNAEDEVFNDFIADLEAVASIKKTEHQAQANSNQSEQNPFITLTLKDHSNLDPDSNPHL